LEYGKNGLNGSNGKGKPLRQLTVSRVQSLILSIGSIRFYWVASCAPPLALLARHTRRCDIPE
jgi:hypothetical protein